MASLSFAPVRVVPILEWLHCHGCKQEVTKKLFHYVLKNARKLESIPLHHHPFFMGLPVYVITEL